MGQRRNRALYQRQRESLANLRRATRWASVERAAVWLINDLMDLRWPDGEKLFLYGTLLYRRLDKLRCDATHTENPAALLRAVAKMVRFVFRAYHPVVVESSVNWARIRRLMRRRHPRGQSIQDAVRAERERGSFHPAADLLQSVLTNYGPFERRTAA